MSRRELSLCDIDISSGSIMLLEIGDVLELLLSSERDNFS